MPYWHIDTGMAALLILQTAVDEGLGACFFGIPPERMDAFRAAFGVPADVHPDRRGHRRPPGRRPRRGRLRRARRPRRDLDEVVHHGRWGGQG